MAQKNKYPWIGIDEYDELAPGRGYPSMRASFAAQPYEGQQRVAAYLRSGKDFMASFALPLDAITGKRIPGTTLVMHDGKYCWSTDLAYYVDQYNLRLPPKIERHILRAG
mgnify:CR=1 FL=1